jgi:hypothetical protein
MMESKNYHDFMLRADISKCFIISIGVRSSDIKVFDIMGREVPDLSNGFRATISCGAPLGKPATSLSAKGVYYYRALVGDESGMRVMVRK